MRFPLLSLMISFPPESPMAAFLSTRSSESRSPPPCRLHTGQTLRRNSSQKGPAYQRYHCQLVAPAVGRHQLNQLVFGDGRSGAIRLAARFGRPVTRGDNRFRLPRCGDPRKQASFPEAVRANLERSPTAGKGGRDMLSPVRSQKKAQHIAPEAPDLRLESQIPSTCS